MGELGEGDHSPPIDQEKYPVVCTDMLELSETSLQTAAAPDNDRVMSTDVDEISSDAASDFDHLSEL